MNKQKSLKLRKLFEKQTTYEKLLSIAEHSKAGQEILIKTSRTNSLTIFDVGLADRLKDYANLQLKAAAEAIEDIE